MSELNDVPTPVTIKKYANRRLYNTSTSCYITLDSLCQMVKNQIDFIVYDAKTGEDITHTILTQIIMEEENKGPNLLPSNFLRQLIRFYGNNVQALVPGYLEYSMLIFVRNQEHINNYLQSTFGTLLPFGHLGNFSKQNIALFAQAMRMFNPFGQVKNTTNQAADSLSDPTSDMITNNQQLDPFEELYRRLDALQSQIEILQKQNRVESDEDTKESS